MDFTVLSNNTIYSSLLIENLQAITLGAFPKLKVVHTGKQAEGQIYIGTINYVLMFLCIAVVAGFNADSVKLGNAYGES